MDPAPYNRLLSGTRTSSVVLRTLLVTTLDAGFEPRTAKSPNASEQFSIKRDGTGVVFTHTYDGTIRDELTDKAVIAIRAVFDLKVESNDELPDEFVEEYSRRQLPMSTRPYFRELVSSCAARALILAPPIPTQIVQPVGEAVSPVMAETPAVPKTTRKPRPAKPA